MPTEDATRPPAEDFDPEQTVFFQRRKQKVNLLPLIVVCALVLGSGALIVWAISQPGKKTEEEISRAPADDPYRDRPVIPSDQAKALENPVVSAPSRAGSSSPAATAARFDDTKPVRAAEPVAAAATDDGSSPPVPADDAPREFRRHRIPASAGVRRRGAPTHRPDAEHLRNE